MNSRDFCYWLQGLFEVAQPETLNEQAVAKIKAHLNMVFIHEIDPSFPEHQQAALNKAHATDNGMSAASCAGSASSAAEQAVNASTGGGIGRPQGMRC